MPPPESTRLWIEAQRLRMRERVLAVALTVLAGSTIAVYWMVIAPNHGAPIAALLSLAEVLTLAFVYFIIVAQMRRKFLAKNR